MRKNKEFYFKWINTFEFVSSGALRKIFSYKLLDGEKYINLKHLRIHRVYKARNLIFKCISFFEKNWTTSNVDIYCTFCLKFAFIFREFELVPFSSSPFFVSFIFILCWDILPSKVDSELSVEFARKTIVLSYVLKA